MFIFTSSVTSVKGRIRFRKTLHITSLISNLGTDINYIFKFISPAAGTTCKSLISTFTSISIRPVRPETVFKLRTENLMVDYVCDNICFCLGKLSYLLYYLNDVGIASNYFISFLLMDNFHRITVNFLRAVSEHIFIISRCLYIQIPMYIRC